jgi:hypothetical protein
VKPGQIIEVGPFATIEEAHAAAESQGLGLAGLKTVETLFSHDGYSNEILLHPSEEAWLRIVWNPGGRIRSGGTQWDPMVCHHLRFPDIETLEATLHAGEVPTRRSYEQTTAAVRTRTILDEPTGDRRGWFLEARMTPGHATPEDELPYPQLLPGEAMLFGPFENAYDDFEGDDARLYRYPVPTDEVLVFHDCDRHWLGRWPDMPERLFGVFFIDDSDGRSISHRMEFEDEETMRATLVEGMAPSLDTYLVAKSVHRETVSYVGGRGTVLVERLSIDDLGKEGPGHVHGGSLR